LARRKGLSISPAFGDKLVSGFDENPVTVYSPQPGFEVWELKSRRRNHAGNGATVPQKLDGFSCLDPS